MNVSIITINGKHTDGRHVVHYSQNWNNKLHCKCFSTVRLWNPGKYRPGERYLHVSKDMEAFEAELVSAQKVQFQYFTEHMALLDTGYGLDDFKNILRKMYKDVRPDTLFGIYIFKKQTF